MSLSLNELIAGVLNMSPADLTPESGPKTLPNWDSLAHVTIASAAEQTYGVRLTMAEILSIKSIQDLQRILQEHGVAVS